MMTKKQIEKEVKVLKEKFDLQGWNIYLDYPKAQDAGYLAEAVESSEYKEATIKIYPKFFEKKNEILQEDTLIHELVHVILAPLKTLVETRFVTLEEVRKANEFVTTHIERIFKKNLKCTSTPKPKKPKRSS